MLHSYLVRKIKGIFQRLQDLSLSRYCATQVEQYGMQYREFSIFAIVNYLFPNFMWSKGMVDGFTMLFLKSIAGGLCAGLLLKENWPEKFHKYFPLYWYFTLLFCLPFTMTVMILDHNFAPGWIIITLLSIFLLASLVSWKDYIIMMPLGITFAVIFFSVIGGNLEEIGLRQEFIFWSFYAIIFASFIGLIFTRNKELLEKERDESAKAIAGMIAHEARNPMFALGGGIYGLKKAIENKDLNKASEVLNFLERTLQETNFTIQMILTNLRGIDSDDSTYQNISIKDCVEEALNEYYFSPGERERITYNCYNDFKFKGNKILMKHILFNLIKNSLSFIHSKKEAVITINTKTQGSENILIFKDTGIGVKQERLGNLFQSFKSTQVTGTGLGLYFCRKVMRSFQGEITCNSVEHEFTIFTLSYKPIN